MTTHFVDAVQTTSPSGDSGTAPPSGGSGTTRTCAGLVVVYVVGDCWQLLDSWKAVTDVKRLDVERQLAKIIHKAAMHNITIA